MDFTLHTISYQEMLDAGFGGDHPMWEAKRKAHPQDPDYARHTYTYMNGRVTVKYNEGYRSYQVSFQSYRSSDLMDGMFNPNTAEENIDFAEHRGDNIVFAAKLARKLNEMHDGDGWIKF